MKCFSDLIHKYPIDLLKTWLKEATDHPHIKEANAMVLSTMHRTFYAQEVSSRIVLLKDIQAEKLIFYTNYNSPKGRSLSRYVKPYAALNFHWPALTRQIRLEGILQKTSIEQSCRYWETRSRESQISQYISQQSCKLENRKLLETLWSEAQKKFEDKKIPRPLHWGGVSFIPHKIEFWQERPHRLHDRLLFVKKGFLTKKWIGCVLYP